MRHHLQVSAPHALQPQRDVEDRSGESLGPDHLPDPLGAAPDFTLRERNGQLVRRDDLFGKVWVAHFFFTECAGGCSTTTDNLAKLHRLLADLSMRFVALPIDVAVGSFHLSDLGLTPTLRLDDAADVRALNDLAAAGARATWAGSGTVRVPAEAADAVAEAAEQHGAVFHPAEAGDGTTSGPPVPETVNVAVAGAADEVHTLGELGFDIETVSTAVLNDGFDWSGTDVLYVSSGLVYANLDEQARADLDAFLEEGGVVARGTTGARFNQEAGLLDVRHRAGRSDANGVVLVEDGAGELAGTGGHGFVYSPGWFTDLGPGVVAEQTYGAEGPLLAGHWRAAADGSGGQDAAAGQASVVSGTADPGASVVLFGTEPLFRNHPKGSFGQVAQALYWTATPAGTH